LPHSGQNFVPASNLLPHFEHSFFRRSGLPHSRQNFAPCVTVWGDEHLVFADIRSPGTVANLRRNPAVEVNVVDPILRKGYRFKGTAEILSEGALFQELFDFYRRDPRIHRVVLIKVKEALPLISPAYDQGLTEDQVRARSESWYASLREGNSGETPDD
jgi:predicted pyridoxine 5'-phosphate oxidase superfamily flavin-nucleotide-binding protein